MAASRATLIVKQTVHHEITNEEILPALTEEVRLGVPPIVEIDVKAEALRAIDTEDWSGAATELIRQFTEKLKPQMEAHPGARLAYFGTAPIPLAMQMGSLVGSWAAVDTYLRHHKRGTWSWQESSSAPASKPSVHGMPQDLVRTEGDAVIRISISTEVDPRDTQAIVTEPLVEIDIKLEPTDRDAIDSMELMDRIASTFQEALDAISTFRPGARTVHVFAAVPVGLAFRMGTRVSSTMHPCIQTYQFTRIAGVRYHSAIALNQEVHASITLSSEDRAQAAETRRSFARAAGRLPVLARAYKNWSRGQANPSWVDFILADSAACEKLKVPPWTELKEISPAFRSDATVDLEAATAKDGFCFERTKNAWQLSDELLIAITRAFPDDEERARAALLLLLHEGIHERHGLTSATSVQVGLFPKILEEVDYQADVWAMLHEFYLMRQNADQVNERAFFLDQIRIVTRTMWAFDAGAGPLYEIQVRRLNRYLIWYWQFLRIERVRDLAGIAGILSQRPILELTGPRVRVREHRVYYQLDPRHIRIRGLELAVLHDNAIYRLGEARSLPLPELIDGLRARDGDRVKEVLRGAFDQLRTVRGDG